MKPEGPDEGVASLAAWLDAAASTTTPAQTAPAAAVPQQPAAAANSPWTLDLLKLDGSELAQLGLTTAADVITYVNQQLATDKAFPCPVCTGTVNRYQRPPDAKAVRWLIFYYLYAKAHPTEKWVHQSLAVARHGQVGGDWARLRHWNLIEECPQDANTKQRGGRTSGFWRITKTGIEWVEGKITIPRYIQTCMGHFEGFVTKQKKPHFISVQEALANKFDHQKLMSSTL